MEGNGGLVAQHNFWKFEFPANFPRIFRAEILNLVLFRESRDQYRGQGHVQTTSTLPPQQVQTTTMAERPVVSEEDGLLGDADLVCLPCCSRKLVSLF